MQTLPPVEVLVLRGRDGTGVNLSGAVPTYDDLPDDLTEEDAGKAYVVQANGLLYVWSGVAWPAEENGAAFRGETGTPGRGITGVSVDGDDLVFAMSAAPATETVTVPALQDAADAAASAQGYAASAESAKSAAEGAASTAVSAQEAAEDARDAALDAQDAAEGAASTATTKAGEASASATAASGSASAAAGSASSAAGSASSAAGYKDAAESAAGAAEAAQEAAESARDAAEGHADAAVVARTGAELARSEALGYAQAAAASAEDAAEVVNSGIPNASGSVKGGIKLAGDLAGTWDAPAVPGLADRLPLGGGTVTGHIVSEAGSPTHEDHLTSKAYVDTKLAQKSGNAVVYTNDAVGQPATLPYTDTATAGTIVARDGSGRAKVAAPVADADVATKKYVDDTVEAASDDAVAAARAGVELAVNKGAANGYASLDAAGKVPVSQLPSSVMQYLGVWSAATNTPTLADGTGDVGDVYRVSVAGTRDLGSGPIEFAVGDYVIYNGSTWEHSDTTDAVASVAGLTGVITGPALKAALGIESDVVFVDELPSTGVVGKLYVVVPS